MRKILVLFLIVLAAATLGIWAGDQPRSEFTSPQVQVSRSWIRAVFDVAVAEVGETPGRPPVPAESSLNLCDDLPVHQVRTLDTAVALMRATDHGRDLFELLESEGVCIGVDNLPYNSAYAMSRYSPAAGWSESRVIIDESYVTILYPDVLAAILVHEATHVDRAVNRTACYYADACTTLANGVILEEEIVAHGAEAEWWIEMYGRDGKDWAFNKDHSQNQLKAAYLRGPGEFRQFVRDARSNEQEGEGI
ncbi:hypothetical protein BH23CHL5_BH23CHL5_00600 [soil metagenome]